jgi:hypothetical protein
MKNILLTLMVFGSFGAFADSFENRILTFYQDHELKLASGEVKENPGDYNYLGISYLNGFFEHKDSGKKYWAYFEANAEKACTYFTKSSQLGSELGKGLLGILFLNGKGCKKDLSRAIELLRPVRLSYIDTASSFGLAIHELIRSNDSFATNKNIQEMIESLKFGAENNQIPALNALYQIHNEGRFLSRDENLANQYRANAKKLINEKIRLQEAINEASNNVLNLSSIEESQQKIGDRKKFIFSLGALASAYYFSQPAYNNSVCTVGCSPPSTVDLINWGIL